VCSAGAILLLIAAVVLLKKRRQADSAVSFEKVNVMTRQ
jgi:hypothetical protein